MSTPTSPYNAALLALREQLPHTRFADRPRLSRELDRLFARRNPLHEQAPDLPRLKTRSHRRSMTVDTAAPAGFQGTSKDAASRTSMRCGWLALAAPRP